MRVRLKCVIETTVLFSLHFIIYRDFVVMYIYFLLISKKYLMRANFAQIFHIDDFEMEILQKACCPFCRVAPVPRTELLTLQSNNEIQAEEEYP